jgi:hypothetical protein
VSGAEPAAVATPRTPVEHADKPTTVGAVLIWRCVHYLAVQQLKDIEAERARLQAIVDRARGHLHG